MRTKTITVQDPREFDGDPYQVAERAIQQLRGLIVLAEDTLEPTNIVARNAELQRILDYGDDIGEAGRDWPESPQGRKIAEIIGVLTKVEADLTHLARAVAFNPKAR